VNTVDEFKVIIKAELDDSALKVAGSGFGKAAKKHLEDNVKIESGKGGGIASSITGLLKKTTSGASGIGESLSKHLGSKAPMLLKLGIVSGILLMVYNVLKSLSPIVAILKLIEAVLTLTLYPIATLLLTFIKPILVMLLKYVILPFGKFMGAFKVGEGAGGGGNLLEDIAKFHEDVYRTIWDTFTKGIDFGGIFQYIVDGFNNLSWSSIWDVLISGLDTTLSVWKIMIPQFGIISMFIGDEIKKIKETDWSSISNEFTKVFDNITLGLTNFVNKIIDLINKLPGVDIGKVGSGISGNIGGGGGGGARDVTNKYNIYTPLPKEEPKWTDPFMKTPYIPDYWSYADSGIANTPQIAKIAEKGPEVVLSMDKLKDLVGNGETTIHFNIDKVEKSVDIDDIVSKIERVFYSNSKRSGAF